MTHEERMKELRELYDRTGSLYSSEDDYDLAADVLEDLEEAFGPHGESYVPPMFGRRRKKRARA